MTSIADIRAKYLSRELTVEEFIGQCKKKAEETKEYGAYLEVFSDIAEQAAKAQKVLDEQGEKSPILTGIPIAVKDNILVKGRAATAASHILEGYVAPYDATVIKKLREAGALFFGRTNMDEFAMGSSTENSAYITTRNPHDKDRVPGGSSGGSAVAVALHTVPVALGSDTGGSIRQPAALCGVVGLKPTYGAVSRYGLMAMGSSLDQIGTFTNNSEDAKLILDIIRGVDTKDSTTRTAAAPEVPKKYTIGVPWTFFEKGVDPDLLNTFKKQIAQLEEKGCAVKEVDLSLLEYSIPAYYISMFAEVSSNLARYDGVRFGVQKEGKTFNESFIRTRTEGLGEEVRRRILLGTYVLSSGYIDAYYKNAEDVRHKMREILEQLFTEVDVIALPTTPSPAFKIGEKKDDPLALYLEDIFTVFANLTGHPAISVPMGTVKKDAKDLPVGLQFVAPYFGEDRLFTIASEVTGEEYTKK